RERHELAVEEDLVLAVAVDRALDDELGFATRGIEAVRLKLALEVLVLADVEKRFDRRLVGAGADHVRVGAVPEYEPHGVEDDRLAGARLARDRVEARMELELELVDDREVADLQ